MKRTIATLLAVGMLLALTACGGSSSSSTPAASSKTAASVPAVPTDASAPETPASK